MAPITHGMIGWVISQPLEKRKDRIFVTLASLIPDIDGLGIVAGVEYYHKYHHILGHNIFLGLVLSFIVMIFSQSKLKTGVLVFISFHLHILGDLLGSGEGWGVYFFWPMSNSVYEFAPPFQWELNSWQNLLVTLGLMVIIIFNAVQKKRTIVEVISTKLDQQVVQVFNRWFNLKKKN